MHIELTDNYCKVKVEEQGKFKEKVVNLSDLLDELSIYRSTNFGLLPKDVRIIESMGNSMVVGIEFPKKTWRIVYEPAGTIPQVFEHVNLPAGIILVKTSRESGGEAKHIRTHIYAIRGKRIMFHGDKLYNFPTPNVYDNGRVCWGNIKINNLKHLSATEGMISTFFNNKFNNDLFSRKLSGAYTGPSGPHTDVASYFNHLNSNEFNDDWLIESPQTISKVATYILKDS